jgi:8-oxo-dGTP pyrophosphatase MutT (NUDIX family)
VPVSLDEIHSRLRAHRATVAPDEARTGALHAAVSVLLHAPDGRSPEIFFIERAVREGDPWSGQMAFPGGRRDPADPDLLATAARETLEEVGIEVAAPIGRLDDLYGTRRTGAPSVVVSPFVFTLADRPAVRTNYEVQSTVWVPLPWIASPNATLRHRVVYPGFEGVFPAIRYDRYTVWGLTYRVLENLFEVLDRPLPARGAIEIALDTGDFLSVDPHAATDPASAPATPQLGLQRRSGTE